MQLKNAVQLNYGIFLITFHFILFFYKVSQEKKFYKISFLHF